MHRGALGADWAPIASLMAHLSNIRRRRGQPMVNPGDFLPPILQQAERRRRGLTPAGLRALKPQILKDANP